MEGGESLSQFNLTLHLVSPLSSFVLPVFKRASATFSFLFTSHLPVFSKATSISFSN